MNGEKRYRWGDAVDLGNGDYSVELVEDPNGPLVRRDGENEILYTLYTPGEDSKS